MKTYIALLVMGILTSNFVLARFLGICPFLGVSRKQDTAVGMGLAVTGVMTLAAAIAHPFNVLLGKIGLEYLQTTVFILIIASLVQILEIIIKRFIKSLYSAFGIFLPLITTNCAVLGIVIINAQSGYNFPQSVVSSLGAGLGFLLAIFMFSVVRSKINEAHVPPSFRGMPITLVAASIVSLSFMGFTGIAQGLGLA
ncbi:MAG: electron transport complex protein RnfA [Clostridiales bacterium]|jgi:electron transport complex protein RnfA|nr:electron transport complex protein RnfA [Clostridiales bacterium]